MAENVRIIDKHPSTPHRSNENTCNWRFLIFFLFLYYPWIHRRQRRLLHRLCIFTCVPFIYLFLFIFLFSNFFNFSMYFSPCFLMHLSVVDTPRQRFLLSYIIKDKWTWPGSTFPYILGTVYFPYILGTDDTRLLILEIRSSDFIAHGIMVVHVHYIILE